MTSRKGCGGDLGGEDALFLLNAFAELEADIVLEHDLGAGRLARLVDEEKVQSPALIVVGAVVRQIELNPLWTRADSVREIAA